MLKDKTIYQAEELIKQFSNLHGASGFESPIRQQFTTYLEQLSINYQIDGLGNVLIKFPHKKAKLTLLIMAHMDEVGFLIHHIDEQGFIRAIPLGRWIEHVLWDKEWIIRIDDQSIVAFSGMDPPHA